MTSTTMSTTTRTTTSTTRTATMTPGTAGAAGSTGVLRPCGAGREAAERELSAARAELASLGAQASPSRLERALERVTAARQALALAA
ncbi:hypothetical protein [Actinomyces howellii]|uniref:Uncharacterized protein n=1 Tax=Actinomyces howellii TaxID=52771 RepID=A0A3S4SL29_9ACTO|nr:hypothetical protein [Actinomyces howellii]VEG25423.1 Uncharacterised protein [Actinomyces howellii]